MKVELSPGETIHVGFKESDGDIAVTFAKDRIKVEADLPDTSGREAVIYEEVFGSGIPDLKTELEQGLHSG